LSENDDIIGEMDADDDNIQPFNDDMSNGGGDNSSDGDDMMD
jgi:hypothetical protein